jgi:flavin-dependent dehydrogenase
VRSGARLRAGVSVAGVRRAGDGRVTGVHGRDRLGGDVELSARFVGGAAGLHSRIARCVGAEVIDRRPDGGAARYAYYTGLPWSGIEFYVADNALAGIFPTHDAEACVWLCTPAGSGRDDFEGQLRQHAPDLAARLRGARRTSPISGTRRSPNHLRRPGGPGWALVGDAGFHRDPISAHGISDAFRDAELLAGCLDAALRGRVEEPVAIGSYERQRNAALADIFDLTCALGTYPPVSTFLGLMRELGRAIDIEAATLAARDLPSRSHHDEHDSQRQRPQRR